MRNLTELLVSFVLLCHFALNVYGGKSLGSINLNVSLLISYTAYIHNCLVFEEVPKSQQVSVGDSATFRCRHQSADTIRWRVDHTLITANPSPDITPTTVREGGHVVHTLTIVARPEYNGTVVECVAMFDDHTPDEDTLPAVLHVLGMIDLPKPC